MTINPNHTNATSLDLLQSLGSRTSHTQQSGQPSSLASDEISLQNPGMAKAMQFLEQMQQFHTSDPDRFKSVMSELSSKLRTAADDSTDSTQKQFLTALSSIFADSAKSGKLELPQPPQGAGEAGTYGPPSRDKTSGTTVSSSLFGSGSDLQDLLANLMDEVTQNIKLSNQPSTGSDALK